MSIADQFIELVSFGEAVAVAAILDQNLDLANLADRSAMRRPVLHLAAEHGRREVVELLLVAGANVDRRDAAGKTAFELAVAGGFLDVVDTLLAAGTSAIATREHLEAAIAVARSRGHRAVQARLERHRRVKSSRAGSKPGTAYLGWSMAVGTSAAHCPTGALSASRRAKRGCKSRFTKAGTSVSSRVGLPARVACSPVARSRTKSQVYRSGVYPIRGLPASNLPRLS